MTASGQNMCLCSCFSAILSSCTLYLYFVLSLGNIVEAIPFHHANLHTNISYFADKVFFLQLNETPFINWFKKLQLLTSLSVN